MRLKLIFGMGLLVSLWTACSTGAQQMPERADLIRQIEGLETQLRQSGSEVKAENAEQARELVTKSQTFVEYYAQDSLAPSVLFKAADVARGLGDFGLAVQLWGQVHRDYADFEKAPEALFLQAFTAEKDQGDQAKATGLYQQFIARYPDHPLKKDVELLLLYLQNDKSPAELVKEFEQQKSQGEKQ